MKKPETPQNEEQRLRSLRSLNILDTPTEERFDRLTRLAKRLFDVPISLVSLVDEDRQWFKSCQGLDASETPRDISFCGHAIHSEEIFIVSDAAKDMRFADNPLVTGDPNIRFYAGCPLRHINGDMLGTLCIIDRSPRVISKEDFEALKDLAELAERELAAIQLATLDDLTAISNRRGFITLAQNSLNMCARQKTPACLIYFDLNGFKLINDEHGHAEGDRALTAFADQMKSTFRDSDVFARMGGDEFAALLTNTPISDAVDIIERFRQSMDEYNRQANRGYDVAFSDGIVSVDSKKLETVEDLLSRADTLMYENKRGHSESPQAAKVRIVK